MAQSIYTENIAKDTKLNANTTANRLGVTQIYTYPPDMGSETASSEGGHVPFVMFFPYERDVSGPQEVYSIDLSALDKLPPPKFCIALPLPSSAIKTKYSVQYESVSLDAAGAMASGVSGLASGDIANPAANFALVLSNIATKVAQAEGNKKGASPTSRIIGTMGKVAESARAAGGDNLLSASTGIAKNPFTEQLFKSVDFRTHEFSYTFIPKNEEDSKTVDDIIQTFRFYMLPSYSVGGSTASAAMSFPYEFQIIYSVRDTTFMLFPSVLESLDVDYGSDLDSPKFFRPTKEDKRQYPMKTTITMKFRELIVLSRERVEAQQQVLTTDTQTQGSTVKRYRF